MQIKNIVAKTKYITKGGEEKIQWVTCGSLFIKDDGKMSIKFYPFINPSVFKDEKGEVWLNVFDIKKKENLIEGNQVPAEDVVPF